MATTGSRQHRENGSGTKNGRASTYLLLLVASAICSVDQSAQSTTLQGRLEAVSVVSPQPCARQVKQKSQLLPDSFPLSYQGLWRCESTVTDSGVSTIAAGQKSTCEIQFKVSPDGRVLANWFQPGWTEAEANPVSFSLDKARVDRTNYYWAEGVNGSWAARSRDDFTRVDDNTILARSYIDQYVDGQYVGRYRTNSVLKRVPDNEGLAGTFK